MSLGKVGFIGRFKPLHLGAANMLDDLCEQAEEVIIGIGSSNKHNCDNPFTVEESEAMVRRYLGGRHGNYTIVPIPDFGHLPEYKDGSRWKEEVLSKFGPLDHFITGNGYVRRLLQDTYAIIEPSAVVTAHRKVFVSGSIVRYAMASGDPWEHLVPQAVSSYLQENGIVERFRKEFGLQTLAALASYDPIAAYDEKNERQKVERK
jgi:nicotinamide-nucleotide adenylyltransferase